MARGAALTGRWRALAARRPGTAAPNGILSAPSLPPFVHNTLFTMFLGGFLAYGEVFASYTLGRFDLVNLLRDVSVDDAFYYFQIAWHLSEGKFSTFDGGITRTNGYHPLWLLLITPFYWIFDKTSALFAIKAFEIMLVAGGVSLIAVAARLSRLPWILLFAALPALYRQHGMLVGMEAAAGLFMLGLFFFAIVLFARDSARWRWPLAVAAFALPWVRLEYAAISLAATTALLLIEWSWQDRSSPGARARSLLACKAVGPLLAAGAGLLVYFGWNGVVFGGIVPVSAAAKRVWSQKIWERNDGYDLTRSVHDYLRMYAFDDELRLVLEVFVYVLLVWWFAHRSRSREGWLLLAFLVGLFGLAAGHLAKFVQSVLTIHVALGSYIWYFVPAYLMEALMIPARCCVAIWFMRRFIGPRLPRASGILAWGVIISGAASLYATTDFAAPFRFVDRRSEATSFRWHPPAIHMGTMVMNRVLPEGSVIGSWDSGMIGYFSRLPVVNLDGLVNSWDYLRAMKEGKQGHFHVQHFGITHFANIRSLSGRYPGIVLFEGPQFRITGGRVRQFRLWTREPGGGQSSGLNPSELFWERMEPHFERQTGDGIRLFVDGRLAQAFSRDCPPGELAAWTWDGREERTLAEPWAHTRTGLCVVGRILPHDASDVRVARVTVGEHLAALRERLPDIRSDFDLHLVEDRLIYVKEPCGRDDVAAPFFVHVDLELPDYYLQAIRRRHGFDNLDFEFASQGMRFDGICFVNLPLPNYSITAIQTGQYVEVEGGFRQIWKEEIRLE